MKNCYYWWTFIFTHHKHEILSYLNKKLSFIIFENPRGEIFRAGMVQNPRGEIFSPRGFANPRGDFDLCHGIFSRSLQILSQKPIEFPQ